MEKIGVVAFGLQSETIVGVHVRCLVKSRTMRGQSIEPASSRIREIMFLPGGTSASKATTENTYPKTIKYGCTAVSKKESTEIEPTTQDTTASSTQRDIHTEVYNEVALHPPVCKYGTMSNYSFSLN